MPDVRAAACRAGEAPLAGGARQAAAAGAPERQRVRPDALGAPTVRRRADASIAAWLAAHKERVALGMTSDGGTTTDHCDTEGMTEEVAAKNAPLVNGQGYVCGPRATAVAPAGISA